MTTDSNIDFSALSCQCPACSGHFGQDDVRAQSSDISTDQLSDQINTGNPDTSAVIHQQGLKWGSSSFNSGATVSYSFLSSVPSYYSSLSSKYGIDYPSSFIGFSAAQKTATREILSMFSDVANINFVETSNVGTITFANHSMGSGVGAYAYYPNLQRLFPSDTAPLSGDVWISNANRGTSKGSWGYLTLIHEIGHAVGLKHPGNYNAGGGGSDGPYLPSHKDNHQHTVMSYYDHPNHSTSPVSPLLFDIAAVQFLYGVNNSTRTGNDTYTVGYFGEIKAIWDAGGNDTLSAANTSRNATIRLDDGEFSSINGTNNIAIAYGANIENATGGSGSDYLYGTSSANRLDGGSGSDRLYGYSGNDTLLGGSGTDYLYGGSNNDHLDGGTSNDRLYGESGDDTLIGGSGSDTLYGGSGEDTALFSGIKSSYSIEEFSTYFRVTDLQAGRDGIDTLYDVEFARFTDGTFSLDEPTLVLSNTSVAENLSAGTVVGNMSIDSAPVGESFTFSLAGTGDGLFNIDADTGVITTTQALDHEAIASIDLTVEATGSQSTVVTQSFTIAVTDVNEAPELIGSELSVEANVTVSTGERIEIDMVSIAQINESQVAVFYINSVSQTISARLFDLDGSPVSGEIEIADNAKNEAKLNVRANALPGGGTVVSWVESAPGGAKLEAIVLDENGTPVGDRFVIDDGAEDATFPFSKGVVGLSDGTLVAAWAGGYIHTVVTKKFTREGTPLTEEQVLTTSRLQSEAPGITELSNGGYVVAWQEGAERETASIEFRIFDAEDQSTPLSIRYESLGLLANVEVTELDDGSFVAAWEDVSVRSDEQVTVIRAQRIGVNGALIGDQVTIEATELGEGLYLQDVTALPGAEFAVSWMVNSSGITDFGDLFVQHVDSTNQIKGIPITVQSSTVLSSYDHPLITLSDGDLAHAWINVDEANVPTLEFSIFGTNGSVLFSVAENTPIGSIAGTVEVVDPDAGDSHTFELLDDAGGLFNIDANTGEVSVAAALDFETATNHQITIKGTDSGGLSNEWTRTVTVVDVNEAPETNGHSLVLAQGAVATAQLVATDDDGDAVTFSLDTDATNGTVTLNSDGSYSYTPNADFVGSDSFIYAVSDGVSITTNTIDVSVFAEGETVVGQAEGEVLVAGNNGDVLDGQGGDDTLHGGAGSDTLIGGDGDDVLLGDGAGIDAFSPEVISTAGPETLIDTPSSEFALGQFSDVAVAGDILALPDGGYIVVWAGTARADDVDLAFQRYDANDNEVGDEVIVDSALVGPTDAQDLPRLLGFNDGGFLLAWASTSESQYAVNAQRFDQNATAVGPELVLYERAPQAGEGAFPINADDIALVRQADGGFGLVVTMRTDNPFTIGNGMEVLSFDGAGALQQRSHVPQRQANSHFDVRTASLADGSFVASWAFGDPDAGNVEGIAFRRFGANGLPLGNETVVDTAGASLLASTQVVGLSDGRFAVLWHADQGATGETRISFLSSNGVSEGASVLLPQLHFPTEQMVATADGGFVIVNGVFVDGGHADPQDLIATHYDGSGNQIGDTITLTEVTGSLLEFPRVEVLASGELVVVWTNSDGAGGGLGQFQRRISFDEVATGDTDPVGSDDILVGGAGDDIIDGGAGNDVAVFEGRVLDYTITEDGADLIVQDGVAGRDGTDILRNVEKAQFADGEFTLDGAAQLSISTLPMPENLPFGGAVGQIGVAFGNSEEHYTFELLDDANGVLSIDNVLGEVTSSSPVDFETTPTLTVVIRATGNFGTVIEKEVTFTVTDVNEAPADIEGTGLLVVSEAADVGDAVGTIVVSDPDVGDTHSFELVDDAGGLFSIDAATGEVTVAGALNFETASSHEIVVRGTDSGGLSNEWSRTVTVGDANDAPLGETSGLQLVSGDVLSGRLSVFDEDGDAVTVSLSQDASNGTVTVGADGTFSYQSDPDYVGPDSFSYRVTDAQGASREQTVTVEAVSAVDPTSGGVVAASDGTLIGDLTVFGGLGAAFDGGADAAGSSAGKRSGTGYVGKDWGSDGSKVLGGYRVFASTNAGFSDYNPVVTVTLYGSDTAPSGATDGTVLDSQQVQDANGAVVSETGGLDTSRSYQYHWVTLSGGRGQIYVGEVEFTQAPASGVVLTGSAGDEFLQGSSGDDVLDGGGGDDVAVFQGLSTEYTVVVNGDGSFTVSDSVAGRDGTDLVVNAGVLQFSDKLVNLYNQKPETVNETVSVDEDGTITGTLSATDPEGGEVVFGLASISAEGLAAGSSVSVNPDGTYSYTPGMNFFGTDSFVYTATDGDGAIETGTITVVVEAVNDTPVDIAETPDLEIMEGVTVGTEIGRIVVSDPDPDDSHTFSLTDDAGGLFAIDPASGVITLNADTDMVIGDSFSITVRAEDSGGLSNSWTRTISVVEFDTSPEAISETVIIPTGTAVTGNLTADDADGDPFIYALNNQASNGIVLVNPDGSYSYTPDDGFVGEDSFEFSVSNSGGSSIATLTIDVGGEPSSVTHEGDNTYIETDDVNHLYPQQENATFELSENRVATVWAHSNLGAGTGGGEITDFYMQVMDSSGDIISGTRKIASIDAYISGMNVNPRDSGGFIIDWGRFIPGAGDSEAAMSFDENGQQIGSEFTVPKRLFASTNRDAAELSNGDYVFVQSAFDRSAAGITREEGFYFSITSSTGQAKINTKLISSGSLANYSPEVIGLSSGGFATLFIDSNDHAVLSVYDNQGEPVSGNVDIYDSQIGDALNGAPKIVELTDGSLVVGTTLSSSSGYIIERYSATGVPIGETISGVGFLRNLVQLPDGGFAAGTSERIDPDIAVLDGYLRIYDSAGDQIGDRTKLSLGNEYNEKMFNLASTADGTLFAEWYATYGDGSARPQIRRFGGVNRFSDGEANGSDGDDILLAGTVGSKLNAAGGNDTVFGGVGNDIIDGGDGIDRVIFDGTASEYSLKFHSDGSVDVTDDIANRDGVDTLKNVEVLQFSDRAIDLMAERIDFPVLDLNKIKLPGEGSARGQLSATSNAGGQFTFNLLDDVSNGSIVLSADGSFNYMPDDGYVGTDRFSISVTDGSLTTTSEVELEVSADTGTWFEQTVNTILSSSSDYIGRNNNSDGLVSLGGGNYLLLQIVRDGAGDQDNLHAVAFNSDGQLRQGFDIDPLFVSQRNWTTKSIPGGGALIIIEDSDAGHDEDGDWYSTNHQYVVRVDENGHQVGGRQLIRENTNVIGSEKIDFLPNGEFLYFGTIYGGRDGVYGAPAHVNTAFYQKLSADFEPLSEIVFIERSSSIISHRDVDGAVLPTGGHVMVWETDYHYPVKQIEFQVFGQNGEAITPITVAHQYTLDGAQDYDSSTDSRVIALADGGFAIGYSKDRHVYVERYSDNGERVGESIELDVDYSKGEVTHRSSLHLVAGPDGGIAVAFAHAGEGFIQFISSDGSLAGQRQSITPNHYNSLHAASDGDGNFVVSWETGPSQHSTTQQHIASFVGGDDFTVSIIGNDDSELLLAGDSGREVLAAGGDDVLFSGAGNDTLNGGEGNDTFVYELGDGSDVIIDSAGNDVLQLGSGVSVANTSFAGDDLVITLGDGSTITIQDQALGNGVETLRVTDLGADLVLASGATGGDASGVLSGTEGDDSLDGGGGDDTIFGNGGNDILVGGEGNDILIGGAGNDTITGGDGIDIAVYTGGDGQLIDTINPDGSITVNMTGSGEGIDTIAADVEFLQFAEGELIPTSTGMAVNIHVPDVSEDSGAGTRIGSTHLGLAHTPEDFTFSLLDDAGGLFGINAATGFLFADGPFDFETAQSHSITIQASDGQGTVFTETVVIPISDINEAPADIEGTGLLVVSEAADVGDAVGTIVVSDPDVGDTHSFELVDDAGGLFSIDAATGEVTVAGALNFETASSHEIVVRGTDSGGLSNEWSRTVTVGDANDAPLGETSGLQLVSGDVLSGRLSVFDEDGDAVTVSLSQDASNGTVTVGADGTFSYQSDPDYVGPDSFSYRVTDAQGASREQTVTVEAVSAVDPTSGGVVAASDGTLIGDLTVFGGLGAAFDGGADAAGSSAGKRSGTGYVGKDWGSDGSKVLGGYRVFASTNAGFSDYNPVVTVTLYGSDTAPSGATDGTVLDSQQVQDANGAVVSETGGLDTSRSYQYHWVTLSGGRGQIYVGEVEFTQAPASGVVLTGSAGDEFLQGSSGDDVLDGGGGDDVAVFQGLSTEYTVVVNGDGSFTVSDSVAGRDGTDLVVNAGRLQFSDRQLNPLNADPVVTSYSGTVLEDEVLTDVLTAADPEGGALSFALSAGPSHGTVNVNADGTFSYTPSGDYSGSDSFEYTVTDDQGAVVTATANVTVEGVAETPVLTVSDASGLEDAAIGLSLSVASSDASETVEVELSGVPAGSTLSAGVDQGGGVWIVASSDLAGLTLTPPPDFAGSFDLLVTGRSQDGSSVSTVSDTVTVTVTGENDAPVASDLTVRTDGNVALSGQLSAVDPDGDALTFSLTGTASNGTAVVNADGSYSYTPAADYFGADSFRYSVSDGQGGVVEHVVTVTVGKEAQAPLLSVSDASGVEDGTISLSISGTLQDTDGGSESLTFRVEGVPAGAILSAGVDQGGGIWELTVPDLAGLTMTPAADFAGTIELSVVAIATEAVSGSATETVSALQVTVTGVNDRPADIEDTGLLVVSEAADVGDAVGTIVVSDPDVGDTHSFELVDDAGGLFAIDAATGEVTVAGALNFETASSHEIVVRGTDSGGLSNEWSRTVTVGDANDAPLGETSGLQLVSGDVLSGRLSVFDEDGDAVTVSLSQDASNGTVTVGADGTFSYQSDPDYVGPDSFSYRVTDAQGASREQTVTVEAVSAVDPTSGGVVAASDGTLIGDLTVFGGLGAAFDGGADAAGSSAGKRSGTGYVGKDWGSDGSKVLGGYRVFASTNAGFSDYNPVVTVTLYGSDTAPSGATDGTVLDSQQVQDANGAVVSETGGLDTSRSYQYHWVTLSGGRGQIYVGEVEFTQAPASGVVLTGSAGDEFLQGSSGDDVLDGGGGDDTLFGGEGNDIAVYSGVREDYTVNQNNDGTLTVTDTNLSDGDDGTDVLTGVETLRFVDGDVDVNEAPVDIAGTAVFSIAEDVSVGAVVGTIEVTDPDVGDTHTFELTDDAGGLFTIDADTGEVSVAGALDFETSTSHTITVKATDSGGLSNEWVKTINVADVNEAPTINADDQPEIIDVPGADKVSQFSSALVSINDSQFAAIYISKDEKSILYQVFDENGTAVGDVTILENSNIPFGIQDIFATSVPGGGAVVSWSAGRDTSTNLEFRQIGDTGQPEGDRVELIQGLAGSVEFEGNQLAVLSDGSLAASWISGSGNDQVLRTRRFGQDGTPLSAEIVLATDTGAFVNPEVTADQNGGYAVLWRDFGDHRVNIASTLRVRLFNSAGESVGEDIIVSGDVASVHTIEMTLLSDGSYVAAWQQDLGFGQPAQIFAQRLSSDGVLIGDPVLIHTVSGNPGLRMQEVATLPDGGYAVSWVSQGGLDNVAAGDLFLQRVTADDRLVGAPQEIDSENVKFTNKHPMISLPNGDLVHGWTDLQDLLSPVMNISLIKAGGESTFVVSEDASVDALVGTVDVSDPDAGDAHTFELTDDAGGLFAIDADTGEISVAGALNFETGGTRTVTVRVTDSGGLSDTQDLTIDLIDVNEAPVDIEGTAAFEVVEDIAVGAVVGTIEVTDPDVGDTHTFELTDDAGGLFTIDADTGEVSVAGALDFETASSHTITVKATDSGGLSNTWEKTIDVTDVIDTLAGGNGEDVLQGGDGDDTYVYELGDGSDVIIDSAGNDVLQLGSGVSVANTSFAGDDLVITLGDGSTITIQDQALGNGVETLRVTDLGTDLVLASGATGGDASGVLSGTEGDDSLDGGGGDDTIFGNGGNDILVGGDGNDSLDGGAGNDTLIGGAGNDTITGGDGIDIAVYTGGDGQLIDTINPDGSITVNMTGSGEGIDTIAADVEFLQFAEGELIPTSTGMAVNIHVPDVSEDSGAGTRIGSIHLGLAHTPEDFTFSLLDDAGGLFGINAATGFLFADGPFDFETAQSHSITIQASDGQGTVFTETVVIPIGDVDELPFDINSTPPLAIAENSSVGDTVETIAVFDPDPGDTHTFELIDDAGGLFAIDPLTGVVTVAGALDHEAASSHQITIRVTDSTDQVKDFVETVQVTDVNEGPLDISGTPALSVPEDIPVGDVVGTIIVNDPDFGDTHTFELIDDAGGRFEISSQGVITVAGTQPPSAPAGPDGIGAESFSFENSEFGLTVNTVLAQFDPHVRALTGGGFVVSWTDDVDASGDGLGIFTRVFDSAGNAVTGDLDVNETPAVRPGSQDVPLDEHDQQVVALNDGGFIVFWKGFSEHPVNIGDRDLDIHGQRYDATGTKVGTNFEITSFDPALSVSQNQQDKPAGTELSGGGFVVVYTTNRTPIQDSSSSGTLFQIFDENAQKVGTPTLVHTAVSDYRDPTVVGLANGGFAVVSEDKSKHQVAVQSFNSLGLKNGTEVFVGSPRSSNMASTAVALDGGGFAAVWADTGSVFAQRFDNFGTPVGNEVTVNDFDSSRLFALSNRSDQVISATATADGGFLVAFAAQDNEGVGDSATNTNVYLQEIDSAGSVAADSIRLNETVPQMQTNPVLARLADDSVIAVWESALQDGDSWGVFGRKIDPAGSDSATTSGENNLDFETATSHDITVRVTDSGGLSQDFGLTVQVTDVFESGSSLVDLPDSQDAIVNLELSVLREVLTDGPVLEVSDTEMEIAELRSIFVNSDSVSAMDTVAEHLAVNVISNEFFNETGTAQQQPAENTDSSILSDPAIEVGVLNLVNAMAAWGAGGTGSDGDELGETGNQDDPLKNILTADVSSV